MLQFQVLWNTYILQISYTISLANKGIQQFWKSIALLESNQVGVHESLGTDNLLIEFFAV